MESLTSAHTLPDAANTMPTDRAPDGLRCPAADSSVARRSLLGAALAVSSLALVAASAEANELRCATNPSTGGIVIHDVAETLRDWCRTDSDGSVRLVVPGGATFQLVASTADPLVTNPGDGSFHAFDAAEVEAALSEVSYSLDGVAADVFILPYPPRAGLASAAGPGLILLAPGVLPLPLQQQHMEFVHELGHVVQYQRMPDSDDDAWATYRELRDITDTDVYWSGASHANRPHEIFAEDFRALFGGTLATTTGTIENSALVPPQHVAGLSTFMLQLTGLAPSLSLSASPNPARGPVVFRRSGTGTAALEIFDVTGRRVATLLSQEATGGLGWTWDGRDSAGRRVGAGIVFARVRDAGSEAAGATLRVTLLP